VKPAADPNESGIVETVTRRRVVPTSESASPQTPDLWDYLRAIPPTEWSKHMIYVYRVEPQPAIALLKTANQYFTLPGGLQVPLADQEEVEFAFSQHYGGGTYRIIVKKGAQWVTQGRFSLGGPIKSITIPIDTGQPTPGSPNLPLVGDTASIANKAIDTIAGQEHQAVNIGIGALNAAANVVRSFADGRPSSAPPGDDITRQFMQVMIARAMQDPFEQFVKFFSLMRELNPAGNSGGGPLVDKLLGAAVDRFMNPSPSGAPVSASAELMRQLPQLGGQVAESLREFRMAREAEARIVALQRGQPALAAPPPQALTPANPPPTNGQPTMEFVEQKIIEILQRPVSAEQAADDAMAFLGALDPGSLTQFAALGEGGVLALFQSRPILKQACNNMPRLVEFIKAFLRMYAEDQAAEGVVPVAPPPPKVPLPN
jgi:hypothetical protein